MVPCHVRSCGGRLSWSLSAAPTNTDIRTLKMKFLMRNLFFLFFLRAIFLSPYTLVFVGTQSPHWANTRPPTPTIILFLPSIVQVYTTGRYKAPAPLFP